MAACKVLFFLFFIFSPFCAFAENCGFAVQPGMDYPASAVSAAKCAAEQVYQLAEHWDDEKCDVLKVSYVEDKGYFNIIDGQHRAIAAKMNGVESLVCDISSGMTESEETCSMLKHTPKEVSAYGSVHFPNLGRSAQFHAALTELAFPNN